MDNSTTSTAVPARRYEWAFKGCFVMILTGAEAGRIVRESARIVARRNDGGDLAAFFVRYSQELMGRRLRGKQSPRLWVDYSECNAVPIPLGWSGW